jgi:hypothetical protein
MYGQNDQLNTVPAIVNGIANALHHSFSVNAEDVAIGWNLQRWWVESAHNCYAASDAAIQYGYPGPSAWWTRRRETGHGERVGTTTASGRLEVDASDRGFVRLIANAGPAPEFGRNEPARVAYIEFWVDQYSVAVTEVELHPELFVRRRDRLSLLMEMIFKVPALDAAMREHGGRVDEIRDLYLYYASRLEAYYKVNGITERIDESGYLPFPEIEVPEGATIEWREDIDAFYASKPNEPMEASVNQDSEQPDWLDDLDSIESVQ